MIDLRGIFRLEHVPPPGEPGGGVLLLRNGPTIEGLNYLLDAAFRDGTQEEDWYIGAISGSGYTEISENDSLASHPGWVEHAGVARVVWEPAAANSGTMRAATVSLKASGPAALVKGVFLTSSSAPGVDGIIYSSAVDTDGVSVGGGGTLRISYDLSMLPRT